MQLQTQVKMQMGMRPDEEIADISLQSWWKPIRRRNMSFLEEALKKQSKGTAANDHHHNEREDDEDDDDKENKKQKWEKDWLKKIEWFNELCCSMRLPVT